jgi:hypothetical protein
MYIWFAHNTLISSVHPYKALPLKARRATKTKDLTMPRVPPGLSYGFRIVSMVSIALCGTCRLPWRLYRTNTERTLGPPPACAGFEPRESIPFGEQETVLGTLASRRSKHHSG